MLPEPLAELLCQQPRHYVDAAAGRNRHDHAHRPVGVVRVRGIDGRESEGSTLEPWKRASCEHPDRAHAEPRDGGRIGPPEWRGYWRRRLARLGQQFVIENRAGAAGVIGTKSVIASPADGTTLLYTPSSLSLTVAVRKKTLPYDVAKDLTPIINVAVSPYALVVHPSLPVRDPSRSSSPMPRPIPAGSATARPGSAALRTLPGELLKTMAGIDIVHVPGEAGMNPALIDLMGGQVQVLFASVPGMLSERSERLRPIAIGGTKALGTAAGPADHRRTGPEGIWSQQLGRIAGARRASTPRS